MNFEVEYSSCIAGFTRLVANRPQRVYLAPGDSAKKMVSDMKSYAKAANLSLPAIHTLSHDESWVLYGGLSGGEEEARKVVRPYIQGHRPKQLFFLEDSYWEGEKIRSIVNKLVINHAIVSHFLVMVGPGMRELLQVPNTEVFSHNNELAYILYHLYNRRRL